MKKLMKTLTNLTPLLVLLASMVLGAAQCEPPVEPELRNDAALSVSVLDPSNLPVKGALVYVGDRVVTTDEFGVARVDHMEPGLVWVTVDVRGESADWEGTLLPKNETRLVTLMAATDPPVVIPTDAARVTAVDVPKVEKGHPIERLPNDDVVNPLDVRLPWPPCPPPDSP